MSSISEALEEALGAWASKLCAMPNIRERERYDAASAILRTAISGNVLDEAHLRINSLGGYVAPEDERGQGFNEAIGKALAEIEALGGKDPVCTQRALECCYRLMCKYDNGMNLDLMSDAEIQEWADAREHARDVLESPKVRTVK